CARTAVAFVGDAVLEPRTARQRAVTTSSARRRACAANQTRNCNRRTRCLSQRTCGMAASWRFAAGAMTPRPLAFGGVSPGPEEHLTWPDDPRPVVFTYAEASARNRGPACHANRPTLKETRMGLPAHMTP